MNDPRHPLTPAIQESICAYIRSGGFPVVAAQAAGVPQKVFEWWMKCGRAARPVGQYRDFYEAVCTAQAHARLCAENHAFEHATVTWLKSGPGKETARMPGWTSPVKPRPLPVVPRGMASDRLQTLITVLLNALKPFPEARAAASDAIDACAWTNEPLEETTEQKMPEVEKMPDNTTASETNRSADRQVPEVAQPAPAAPPATENASAPAAAVAEIKVFSPAGEPAGKQQESSTRDAASPHRSDIEDATKKQPGTIEAIGNPQRKEPSLGEALREMYWNLLRSG